MPAAMNETRVKESNATRSGRWFLRSLPYRMKPKATMVMEIGANQATCSFHSIPRECQPVVAGLDMSKRWGNIERSTGAGGGAARYHGKMGYAPVRTAAHASRTIAIR